MDTAMLFWRERGLYYPIEIKIIAVCILEMHAWMRLNHNVFKQEGNSTCIYIPSSNKHSQNIIIQWRLYNTEVLVSSLQ